MQRHVRDLLGRFPSALLWLLVGAAFISACKVDKVPFSRLEEGKKFLAAEQPFQAIEYFQEALTREKDRAPEAHAYLAVAYDRAAKKVGLDHPEATKHLQGRDEQLNFIRSDKVAIEYLAGILQLRDVSSQSAADLMVSMGPEAMPALLQSYQSATVLQDQLLEIMAKIGEPAVPAIAQAASGSMGAEARMALVRLLGTIGGDSAKQALLTLRNDSVSSIQVEAAAALYRLGEKGEREFLLAALDNQDPLARRAASYATTFLNETPSSKVLVAHLEDSDKVVRANLAQALCRYTHDGETMQALIALIRKDPDADVANHAVRSLSQYGGKAAEPVVKAIGVERDWLKRQRLVQVLKDPGVQEGFTQNLEFELYEFWEKKETNPEVKRDLAELLKALE